MSEIILLSGLPGNEQSRVLGSRRRAFFLVLCFLTMCRVCAWVCAPGGELGIFVEEGGSSWLRCMCAVHEQKPH